MDWINQGISWLEANWGTAVFGTLSLGSVITTLYFLVKQYFGQKVIGTKYENMWNKSQKAIGDVTELYLAEKAKNGKVEVQNIFMQQAQNVMMDAIIKMVLASKMDSDDKQSVVANVERLKLLAPKDLIEEVKENADDIVTNIGTEINENPAQTAVNIMTVVGSLLDKYDNAKE